MMVADTNMWINVGRSQFHLPTGKPQVLRGHTALVIAGREALLARLAGVAKRLEGTRFSYSEHNDYVAATCPWGNRVRCYEPDPARFGRITLGIPYVEFDVPVGAAAAIADFYPRIMGVPAQVQNGDGTVARAKFGRDQYLQFRETDAPQPEFDGHHVQMYIVDFSGPYRPAAGAQPRSRSRTTSISTVSRTSSTSTAGSTCSRSSTRCAASPTRCACGRWSTAIRR